MLEFQPVSYDMLLLTAVLMVTGGIMDDKNDENSLSLSLAPWVAGALEWADKRPSSFVFDDIQYLHQSMFADGDDQHVTLHWYLALWPWNAWHIVRLDLIFGIGLT